MSLMFDSDFFAFGVAAGVLGLVFLLSLIVAKAYEEPTLFFLAGYLFCVAAVVRAASGWQLAQSIVEDLLLIGGTLVVAGLQIWVLKKRKNNFLNKFSMVCLVLVSLALMIFNAVIGAQSDTPNGLAAATSIAWAIAGAVCVGYLTFQPWDAAGPWKWWLLSGQFAGLFVCVFFLAQSDQVRQPYWPVILMLLVQAPPIYLSLVWRSRLLNEIRLRSASAGVSDPLTGLATTPVLIERLMRVMARTPQPKLAQSHSVLFLVEVQNWSSVLSELGADFNEKLLLESAMRLRRVVGDSDLIARIAGGRFAVLAQELASRDEITAVATKLVVSGLRIDSVLLPGVELKFRVIVLNLKISRPLSLPIAQAWLGSLVSRFQSWPPTHSARSILQIEEDDNVTERFEVDSNY